MSKETIQRGSTAGKVCFVLCSGLVCALMLSALELNQNSLWGIAAMAAASAAFWVIHHRFLAGRRRFVRCLGWLAWLGVFALILLLSWPGVRPVPAIEGRTGGKTEVISLSDGQVRGVQTADGAVEVFAGIPFAQPPVGELRWKEPRDPLPWDGILEADTFAPMSMQPVNLPIYDSLARIIGYHDYSIRLRNRGVAPVSEDSLYLNLWRPPGGGEKLPVLVYVHGGSLKTGQPWYEDYSGQGLAREGVIVVNMAYRLGVFGFFADGELAAESPNATTGNYGLLDQIKALEWVRDNIAQFGGDPDNVTLAGESAGAACVSALCTSPLAEGLFERVILESSTLACVHPPHSFRLLDEALQSGSELKDRHHCTSVSALRVLPAEELVAEADTQHHITVDGYVLTETPYESYRAGRHNESAILHGYNSKESGPFILFSQANLRNYESKLRGYFGAYADDILALYPAATDREARENWAVVYGATFFDYPHYCLNRLAVENGIPVYEYLFSKENGRLGAWHSGEEVYCYGNIPAASALYDGRDRELSAQMLAYWKNFIVSGDSNGAGAPEWEQNRNFARLMGFGDGTGMLDEPKLALYAILDRMDGWA